MATTRLFVELLVIGIGVAVWLSFLLATIFNLRLDLRWWGLEGAPVFAFFGIAYVLGILVDRAAYSLFQPLEKHHREKILGEDPEPPVEDRERFILVQSSALRDQILYNRSRLRICRAWMLNFFLICLFSEIWALQIYSWALNPISLTALGLAALTAFTANTLVRDHYRNIRASYDFLLTSGQGK